MAVKTRWWVSAWFALTAPVIMWDVGYCFMRPRSMKGLPTSAADLAPNALYQFDQGGDLHWIWRPYALYQEVDYVYGLPALMSNDGFTNAQSLMNVIETILNLVYVYLAHGAQSPGAPVVGFASIVMTLSKTVLYWLNEYYCGYCHIGHNDTSSLITLWIIPNGLWILVPTIIVWVLGNDIAKQLTVASKVAVGKTTKTQKTK